MKVSFTREILLLFSICLRTTSAEHLITNYYQQFEGELSFNATKTITIYIWSEVECILVCNQDPSCIRVVIQEINNNNIYVKMNNSLSEDLHGLICLKGKVKFINRDPVSI